jgi:hypothetical protein
MSIGHDFGHALLVGQNKLTPPAAIMPKLWPWVGVDAHSQNNSANIIFTT